jgi:hypothetical protein
MPGPGFQRFVESMKIGFEEWHDGIGYDVHAFAGMDDADRAAVEVVLLRNLAGEGDWRDVEALAALGTPGSTAALKVAARHRNPKVKERALSALSALGGEAAAGFEDEIERAVRNGAIDLAQDHPTPRVKRALLDCARLADPVLRVNAAAMLMYLCGKADEPFDWAQRPFFLRFASDDGAELRAAWTELRERTGV